MSFMLPRTLLSGPGLLWLAITVAAAAPAAPVSPAYYRAAAPVLPTSERWVTPTLAEPAIMNPPGFRWHPVVSATTYELAISDSPDFSAATTRTYAGLTLTLFTPDMPLSPGRWFWRVRGALAQGAPSAWSETYRFDISTHLSGLNIPPLSTLVASLKTAGHPRLLLSRKEIPEWCARLKQGLPAWTQLQAELAKARQLAAWLESGQLDFDQWRPSNPSTPHLLWRNRVVNLGGIVEGLGLSYLLTGHAEDGRLARLTLLRLAALDSDGPTANTVNDTAFRLATLGLTRGYDLLAATDLLTAEDRHKIFAAFSRRQHDYEAWFARPGSPANSWPANSHVNTSLVLRGELAATLVGDLPEAERWLADFLHTFTANYTGYGRADGGWAEGPFYNRVTFDIQIPSLWRLHRALGVNLLHHPFLAGQDSFLFYIAPSWSKHLAFGDIVSHKYFAEPAQRSNAAPEAPAPPATPARASATPALNTTITISGGGYLSKLSIELEKMFGAPSLLPATAQASAERTTRLAATLPLAAIFPDVGHAILRTSLDRASDDVQVMIKNSPFGSVSHSHADQGNLFLAAYGEPLLVPTGYYGSPQNTPYGSPPHIGWNQLTRAHNLPLIDGYGQASRTQATLGQIDHFFHSPHLDVVRTDLTAAYVAQTPIRHRDKLNEIEPGLGHRTGGAPVAAATRDLVFLRPDLVIVHDRLRTTRPASIQWRLHALAPFLLDEPAQTLRLRVGDAHLWGRLLATRPATFSQTDRFTIPPGRADLPPQHHFEAAYLASPDNIHEIYAVLAPHRGEFIPPTVTPVNEAGWTGLDLSCPSRFYRVRFANDSTRPLALEGVTATAALVATDFTTNTQGTFYYAADCRQLTLPDGQSFQFSAPVDALLQHAGSTLRLTVQSRTGFALSDHRTFPAGPIQLLR